MTSAIHRTGETFASTFGNHHYQAFVAKAVVQNNTVSGVLKPTDWNKRSVSQTLKHPKSTLNNQLYIDSFCEKENQKIDHTPKSIIY
jgi:hypothetical protein